MTSFKVLAQPLRDVDMGQRGVRLGLECGGGLRIHVRLWHTQDQAQRSYQSPSLTHCSCTFLPLRLGRWCLEINAHEDVGLGLHILLLDRFSVNARVVPKPVFDSLVLHVPPAALG